MISEIFNAKNCQGVMAQLSSLGITGKAAAKAGGIVWAHGQFSAGYFQPAPNGKRVLVVPVYRGDIIVDLIAFNKTKFGALYGDFAFALGEDHLINAPVMDAPIKIYRHPITWLRNGGDGIVILNPEEAWARLSWGDNLICEDVAHGREVRNLLKPPPPRAKILVQPSQGVAV